MQKNKKFNTTKMLSPKILDQWDEKYVFTEIEIALKEYFVAFLTRECSNCLSMHFANGQSFRLTLDEIF